MKRLTLTLRVENIELWGGKIEMGINSYGKNSRLYDKSSSLTTKLHLLTTKSVHSRQSSTFLRQNSVHSRRNSTFLRQTQFTHDKTPPSYDKSSSLTTKLHLLTIKPVHSRQRSTFLRQNQFTYDKTIDTYDKLNPFFFSGSFYPNRFISYPVLHSGFCQERRKKECLGLQNGLLKTRVRSRYCPS